MSSGQPDPADALIGQFIGSYRVERRLGEGGMGAVYELVHPRIGKRLAMKLLHAEYAARPQIVQRFFDEARAVNLIGHPNIVDIIDFAELPDGRSYITMEFLEGDSLAAYIRQRGALPVPEARQILAAICSALQAAHDAGIIHRDLKPENIHVAPRSNHTIEVKVLDFGIAKLSGDLQVDGSEGTRSGVVMGTPTYMSPEQAMGRTRQIDHRTDIYALGVIAYEMLAGQVPFAAESFGDLMLKHLQEPPPPLSSVRPDLSPAWEQLISRSLAKDREHRFQSMGEMAAAIDAAAGGAPASTGPQPVPGPTVAMPPGAHAPSSPPSMPGQPPMGSHPPPAPGSQPPGGTMRYDQVPPAAAAPPSRPGTGSHPGAAPPRSRGWLIPATVIAILAAAAVVVVLIARGGGAPGAATAGADAATADAAGPPDAPLPPDAAPDAAPPPDAPLPPDAAARKQTPDEDRDERRRPRGRGRIKITAVPWAEVTIGGDTKGFTPLTVTLPAGRHRIVLANDELGKRTTRTVRVRAKRQRSIRVDFTK